MKTTIWCYISDSGDGSAHAKFFNSQKKAEKYADKEFDLTGQRLCEDIFPVMLEIDENGKLLNPSSMKDFE